MTSNILVKLILAAVVLAAGLLLITHWGSSTADVNEGLPPVGGEAISPETLSALNIEADTPEDTVKTLVTNVREAKQEMENLRDYNERLRLENERLTGMEAQLMTRIRAEIKAQNAELLISTRRERQAENDAFKKSLRRMESDRTQAPQNQPPLLKPLLPSSQPVSPERTLWLKPIEVGGMNDPTPAGTLISTGLDKLPWTGNLNRQLGGQRTRDTAGDQSALGKYPPAATANQSSVASELPAYTLPKNSTLVGATAFTALIGRVPVGQNVVDPYSFKVIIGKDNLIANGAEISELAYAVVSGKAVGDWTLSCVTGTVYSITFVFDDGRIRTIPKPVDISAGGSGTPELKIGELSDDLGNPCVIGRKISNAAKYLASRTLAVAAGAAARASNPQITTTTVGSGGGVDGITVLSGSRRDYIIDETLAGAAAETAQWIRDRQALEFDAVYVEPGKEVAIHITEEIRIDYDTVGRLVRHADFEKNWRRRALD